MSNPHARYRKRQRELAKLLISTYSVQDLKKYRDDQVFTMVTECIKGQTSLSKQAKFRRDAADVALESMGEKPNDRRSISSFYR